MSKAQDHFYARRWGAFFHYLDVQQNGSLVLNTVGKETDWDECVNELDVKKLAKTLHEIDAGYVVFTLQQQTEHLCAPNETFEKLTGIPRGKGTCHRDVVMELSDALQPYDIDLFLYFTGDGPLRHPEAMKAISGDDHLVTPIKQQLIDNWTAVMREYSLRYGKRVSGWWMDGVYESFGYTLEGVAQYEAAARAGNPDTLFSCNYYGCCYNTYTENVPGVGDVIRGDFYHEIPPCTPLCDYTAGEVVSLDMFPKTRFVNGKAQSHVLSFLGIPPQPIMVYNGWARIGSKYTAEYLYRYIKQFNELGGVVTLDMGLYRDGHLDPAQLEAVSKLKELR